MEMPVLERGAELEGLATKAMCLSMSSRSFSRASRPSGTFRGLSNVAGAVAKVARGAGSAILAAGSAVHTAGSRLGGSWAGSASGEAPPAVPLPTSEGLRGKDSFFVGQVQHEAFGPAAVPITLVLTDLKPEGYLGRWEAMGQVEPILLTVDKATWAVHIQDQDKGTTVLQGKLDLHTGAISGEMFQDGVGGGWFRFEPQVARVDLTDTDGDHLSFVRLPGGGVAEYCNDAVVIAAMNHIRMDEGSGECQDPTGSFTIPAACRAAKLLELKALFEQAGVVITA